MTLKHVAAATVEPPPMSHPRYPPARMARPVGTALLVESKGRSPSGRQKRSFDYVSRNFLAGGIAGCAAKTLVAPLDRVKILFQTSSPQYLKYHGKPFGMVAASRAIYSNEGLTGLYRGHSATLLRIFPYAAIKFVAYEQFRDIIIPNSGSETHLRRFVAGSLAGITSVITTYPLEVVRVRMAFETRKDHKARLSEVVQSIYHEGNGHKGAESLKSASTNRAPSVQVATKIVTDAAVKPAASIANFYRGFTPTMVGMIPYAGISFFAHDLALDFLRQEKLARYTRIPVSENNVKLQRAEKPLLKTWAELCAGGFAGLLSQTVSYPLEIVRRQMQVGGAHGSGRFLGMWETAQNVWRRAGARGFFVGLTIGYVKIVPMTATSFFVYERAKLYLGI